MVRLALEVEERAQVYRAMVAVAVAAAAAAVFLLFAVGACGGGGIVVVEVEAMIFFFLGWRCGDSRTKEKETVVLPGF